MKEVYIAKVVEGEFGKLSGDIGELLESATGDAVVYFRVEPVGAGESEGHLLGEVAEDLLNLFKRDFRDFYAVPNPNRLQKDSFRYQQYPLTEDEVAYLEETVNSQLVNHNILIKRCLDADRDA